MLNDDDDNDKNDDSDDDNDHRFANSLPSLFEAEH